MPELTLTGTPTFNANSSCTIDAGDAVDGPAALLFSPTQFWFAIRFAPSWSAAAGPGYDAGVFTWAVDVNNRIEVQWDNGGGMFWGIYRIGGGAGGVYGGNASSHAAGAHITLVAAFTSATQKLSNDGSVFNALAASSVPSLSTPFNIGTRNGWVADRELLGDVYWFAAGKGTLTDADAATINSWGDTDPEVGHFTREAQATMVWHGESARYEVTSGATFIPSWKRRPVPMIKGPDTDKIAGMRGRFAR